MQHPSNQDGLKRAPELHSDAALQFQTSKRVLTTELTVGDDQAKSSVTAVKVMDSTPGTGRMHQDNLNESGSQGVSEVDRALGNENSSQKVFKLRRQRPVVVESDKERVQEEHKPYKLKKKKKTPAIDDDDDFGATQGDFKQGDIAEAIVNAKQTIEDDPTLITMVVAWKTRPDGVIPEETEYTNKELYELDPKLLVRFYESRLTFVPRGRLQSILNKL